MDLVLEAILDFLVRTALSFLTPKGRRLARAPAPAGPGLHARRHVSACYRRWARRAGWTPANDAWEGTVRGVAVRVHPHLGDDSPGAVEVNVGTRLARAPATLRSAAEALATSPDLAALFATDALVRIRWTAEALDLRFAPLTAPETVADTSEAAIATLLAPEGPYRG